MVLRQQKHHGQCVILCEHELPTSRYEYIGREQLLILSIISVVVVRDCPKATNSIWSLAAVAHTFRRRRRPCRNQNAQLRTWLPISVHPGCIEAPLHHDWKHVKENVNRLISSQAKQIPRPLRDETELTQGCYSILFYTTVMHPP